MTGQEYPALPPYREHRPLAGSGAGGTGEDSPRARAETPRPAPRTHRGQEGCALFPSLPRLEEESGAANVGGTTKYRGFYALVPWTVGREHFFLWIPRAPGFSPALAGGVRRMPSSGGVLFVRAKSTHLRPKSRRFRGGWPPKHLAAARRKHAQGTPSGLFLRPGAGGRDAPCGAQLFQRWKSWQKSA